MYIVSIRYDDDRYYTDLPERFYIYERAFQYALTLLHRDGFKYFKITYVEENS